MQYLSGEGFGPAVGWAMWELGRGHTRAQVVEIMRQKDFAENWSRELIRSIVRQAEFNNQARTRVESLGKGRPIEQYFGQPLSGCDVVGIRVVWPVETSAGTSESAGYIFNVPQGMTLAEALQRAESIAVERVGTSPKLGGGGSIVGEPRVVSIVECGFRNATDL